MNSQPLTDVRCGASDSASFSVAASMKNPLVLGVVDDLDKRFFEQPGIDGVKHQPLAGHAVKQLEMMMGVPCQRSQAVALRQAKGTERGRKPQTAFLRGGIAVAMNPAVDAARNDFRFAMRGRGVAKDIRRQQWRIHHQAEHGCPPTVPPNARPFEGSVGVSGKNANSR
jgi:hypothetical protein